MRYASRGRYSLRSYLTPVVAWLFGLQMGFFLVWMFATKGVRGQLEGWLNLVPYLFVHKARVWTIATTAFLDSNALSFLFNALMLWFFVPAIERMIGSRKFLKFTIATVLVGNAVALGVALLLGGMYLLQPITGVSSMIFASVAAIGVMHANQPVQLFGVVPIKGKHVAIGTVVFVLFFVLLNADWANGAGNLAAMGLAWVWFSGMSPSMWLTRWRRARLRRRVQVLDGGARDNRKQWLN